MTNEIKKRIEQVKNGKIPEGYQNRFSLSPIIWNEFKLSKLCKKRIQKNKGFKYDIVLSNTAAQGVIRQSDYFEKDIANAENIDTYFVVKDKDFVYNPRISAFAPYGPIHSNQLGIDGIVSPLYTVFNLIGEKYVSYEYLNFYFDSSLWNKYMYSVANYGARHDRMNIGDKEFFDLPICIPSIKEQEKIVEILTHCDKVIKLKKQLISEESKQKKWLMQNLLNPDSGVRLEGFEGEWKEKTMGELFEFGPSLSASREQLSEIGTCYLHYGDIHSNTSRVVDVQRNFDSIPKLSIDNISSKVLLYDGDVVFVDASEDYEGASKYVVVKNENAIPFIAGLHTIPAKSIGEELVLDFKRFCFQSYEIKKQIAFYASGMKVFGLSKMNIAKIVLKYPHTDEQTAIADILSTADRKIELLEQELEQWQLKKKALMQLLLTGIVRVNV
ncbi:restriction endonuclease subunit S [Desulfosporosinus sp. FKA]|uniref:restriction endonuclease subunit S n=1 Tax=Desulfosporosinus sp. FKA TaxID=1969834 RepID=UPI000B49E54A|nr:restriction endonuclease subunit S [Desulfosporosinus sp. FKA]